MKYKINLKNRKEERKMRNKKQIAIVTSVLAGVSSAMVSTATPLFALETSNIHNDQPVVIANDARAKTIYVQTLANPGGDGSQANPYDDFVTAYQAANDGDTIMLLNAVTIQNGGADNVFKFDKNISIVGDGINSQLTSRVPIQLQANLSISNTEFVTDAVYLNGYSLEMNEVKTNTQNTQRISIYGGSSVGTTQSGNKSILKIKGFKQNPIELDTIYAGNETGVSTIPVDIQLNSGVKVLDSINASGKDSQVNADVNIFVGDVTVPTFVNTSNTSEASLHFKNYVNTNGPRIQGYHDVKLEDSKIVEADATAFTGISGELEFVGKSILDISANQNRFVVNELNSEMSSQVILNKEKGQLKVNGKYTGSIELRTPGGEATNTSGPVNLLWTYIEMDATSDGMIWFKKYHTQSDISLKLTTTTNLKQWSFVKDVKQPLIDELTLGGDQKIDLDVYEHSFEMNALDKLGNALQYTPVYEYELKDPNGAIVSTDDIDVYDDGNGKLYLYVENDTVVTGMYTLAVKETVAGKTFEFQMEFYRNVQQNPYTISFDANGGSGNMNVQSVNVGDKVPLEMNAFQKEGHSFRGWATKKDGAVVYQDGQEIQDLATAGNNLTLYAVWEVNSYQVTFQSEGATVQNQSVVFNTNVKEPIAPIREGYTFKGWYTDPTYQQAWDFSTQKMPAKDIVLYARWEKNSIIELDQAPIIHAEDKVLYVGDGFQPLADVYATDKEDGKIVLTEANIQQNTVNTKIAGVYFVTYEVKDSKGQITTKTIKVTVNDKIADIPTQSPDSNDNSSGTITKPNQSDKNETPNTGDRSNLGLWNTLMTIFVGLFGVLAVKKKKSDNM